MKLLFLALVMSFTATAQTHTQVMQSYIDFTVVTLKCVEEIDASKIKKVSCEKYLRLANGIINDPNYLANLRELETLIEPVTIQDLYRCVVYIDNYYNSKEVKF